MRQPFADNDPTYTATLGLQVIKTKRHTRLFVLGYLLSDIGSLSRCDSHSRTGGLPSEVWRHRRAALRAIRKPLSLWLCLCRTTQDVTRIEQDIWLNAECGVLKLSLREPSDRLMLIRGQRHLIRCRCGKVHEPDMVMRGGNRMDIQIDGWV